MGVLRFTSPRSLNSIKSPHPSNFSKNASTGYTQLWHRPAPGNFDTAEHMGRYFDVADLEQPNLFCEILVGSDWKSPILAWLSSTVRTMLPQIEMIGAATDQQIEIENS